MWNQILEDAIVGKVMMALVDAGYRVEISDQDGGGLYLYAWNTDRRPSEFNHWVRLVPGNGADVLSDYSTNLESVVAPVNAFAARFME